MADPRVQTQTQQTETEALAEGATAEAPVTMAAVSDLISAAVGKLHNDLAARIGRIAKTEQAAEPAASTGRGETVEKTLRDRLAALEAKEAAAKSRAIRMAVREKLVANGADPVLAEMATAAIIESEGDRFEAAEDRYGSYAIRYGDSSADDWAKAWMQSDAGKRIAAGASAPSMGLNGRASKPVAMKKVHVSQAHLVSPEELRSGRIEITY